MFYGVRTRIFALDSLQQGGLATGSLKRPIFEETSERAIRMAHRRKWTLIATLSAFVLIGAALLTYSWQKGRQERALTQEFLEIDAVYRAEAQSFEDKLKADPKLNTPEARPNHGPSAQKFADFAKVHVKSPLGWQAALRAANTYIEEQKYAEARYLLEPLLIKTLKHMVFQVRVRKTLAGVLAELDQIDPALEHLIFLEKLPDNPIVPEVRLMHAQLLYKKGQKDEAAKILRELAADKSDVGEGNARSVSSEAALWLGYWGL